MIGRCHQHPRASGGAESTVEGRFGHGVAITPDGMPLATQTIIRAALDNKDLTNKALRWLVEHFLQ